jgi:hypothetical protein
MTFPRLTLVLVLLVVASAIAAGCIKKEDTNPPPSTTPPSGGSPPTGTTPTPTDNGTGTGGGTPPPQTQPVKDSGQIQGQFEKSWTLTVPVVAPRDVVVLFNLTGAQAGAPPTAQVYLTFSDPNGKMLKSATIGLNGPANVQWAFTAADITATGSYTLKATSQPATAPLPQGLPSGGLANYDLFAKVDY